jgi:hypothetical protein
VRKMLLITILLFTTPALAEQARMATFKDIDAAWCDENQNFYMFFSDFWTFDLHAPGAKRATYKMKQWHYSPGQIELDWVFKGKVLTARFALAPTDRQLLEVNDDGKVVHVFTRLADDDKCLDNE